MAEEGKGEVDCLSSSDREEEEEDRRTQFRHHLATFAFHTSEPRTAQAFKASPSKARPLPCSPQASTSRRQHSPQERRSTTDVPRLPDTLIPSLRTFRNCPLCLQPFPVLSIHEGKVETSKKKQRKAVSGAARLEHVQMCALHLETTAEVVLSLVEREKIRLDRNQRREYEEVINNQGLWMALTGDEPPSSQAPLSTTAHESKMDIKEQMQRVRKRKAQALSVAFKAGRRGGCNRASTTILASRLTRAQVKQRCFELFGRAVPGSHTDVSDADVSSMYGHHDESTARCREASTSDTLLLGLGVGACARPAECDDLGSKARLGMGFSLGSALAEQYKASE